MSFGDKNDRREKVIKKKEKEKEREKKETWISAILQYKKEKINLNQFKTSTNSPQNRTTNKCKSDL